MLSASHGWHFWNSMGDITSTSDPFKLLNMANEFDRAGVLTYAVELYIKILDQYPDTMEAVAARLAVFLIAKGYENEGNKETAIALVRKVTVISNENC